MTPPFAARLNALSAVLGSNDCTFMVTILHISDPHAQSETMRRLEALAISQEHTDVIALTGDCASGMTTQVPATWNDWPQKLKLSVPGNHDRNETFNLLYQWTHKTPWVQQLGDLTFIGLNTSKDCLEIKEQLDGLDLSCKAAGSAVVILSHRWPDETDSRRLGGAIRKLASHHPVLVLHGHDHPEHFSGSLWDRTARLGELNFFRSKVCSSVSQKRAIANLITWDKIMGSDQANFSLQRRYPA